MRPRLGDSRSAVLAVPDGRDLQRFTAAMAAVGHRQDRAESMADYVASVAQLPAGKFRLSDIARISSTSAARDRFRHLIERSNWDMRELRDALVFSAFDAEALALSLVIESEVDEDGGGRDLIALVAVGDGCSTPVDWAYIPYPPLHPGVCDAIRGGVVAMLERFAGTWLSLSPRLLPVLSGDTCFGEDRHLRTALRERDVEFHLPIPRDYDEAAPIRHPYESVESGKTVAEIFTETNERPAMRELRADCRDEAEYVVARTDGSYGLAFPVLELSPGALRGHRPSRRVAELANLSIAGSCLIRDLRIKDFDYGHRESVLRHAWLMSAYAVFSRGRFKNRKELRR